MCGGCGARSGVDWAAPFLGSAGGREAAARVVRAAAGRPVDVRPVAGGWLVRRPTGASLVAGTLTALVGSLGPPADADVELPPAPGRHLPAPDRRRPVVLVHGPTSGAVDAGVPGWAERLVSGRSGVVAAHGDPRPVLAALLADPLRRHVRVDWLDAAALPGWGPVAGRLPGVPVTVPPDRVPALAALLALRLPGRPPGERTRTRVGAGRATVVLDALGPTVLGAWTDVG
ncbi:hypothetical protein SAMN04488107_3330 [Geodermatophilus saharensis]|uniref:Uncharacterized protein n=1 Tax=Geodermatophilus saharensis TaxID=1137994 RepID=A0A239G9J5_9ACTN|nr:hypothetical protein [Geodermatophilus saharensis]SNS65382.1 hypothetical protein SAMN04488107_3330 [Geodermatophilus saharensis]